MKILIAPDSFKGSLSAARVAEHLKKGLLKGAPSLEVTTLPLSDGGEGLIEILLEKLQGKMVYSKVKDPVGREIRAAYGQFTTGFSCVELAMASGITLLKETERDPKITSTYGSGQLIREAIMAGSRKVILGLGGSATNDAGAGILQALGVKLLDRHGAELLPGGLNLSRLASISTDQVPEEIRKTRFIIACDVKNPLTGPNGATYIYGPQKGATQNDMESLEFSMINFAKIVQQCCGKEILSISGAGAAGGTAAGLSAVFNAEIRSGFKVVSDLLGLEKQIEKHDLVITGEGKMDSQSLEGKVPVSVAQLGKFHRRHVIGVAGLIEGDQKSLKYQGFSGLYSLAEFAEDLSDSMNHAPEYLELLAEKIASNLS